MFSLTRRIRCRRFGQEPWSHFGKSGRPWAGTSCKVRVILSYRGRQWPDLTKFLYFGKILQIIFGNFLRVYLICCKDLNLLWKIQLAFGPIYVVVNVQILSQQFGHAVTLVVGLVNNEYCNGQGACSLTRSPTLFKAKKLKLTEISIKVQAYKNLNLCGNFRSTFDGPGACSIHVGNFSQ